MDLLSVLQLIVFVTMLVLGYSVVVWNLQRAAEREEAQREALWRRAASDIGLDFVNGGLGDEGLAGIARVERQLVGRWRGAQVRVQRLDRGFPPTSARVRFVPSLEVALHVELLRGNPLLFDRIQTGDALFDEAFLVLGERPLEVTGLLTHEVRVALLALARHCPGAIVDQEGIWWSQTDDLKDPEQFEEILGAMKALTLGLIEAEGGRLLRREPEVPTSRRHLTLKGAQVDQPAATHQVTARRQASGGPGTDDGPRAAADGRQKPNITI